MTICCGFGPIKTLHYEAFVVGKPRMIWLPGELVSFEPPTPDIEATRSCSFCKAEWKEFIQVVVGRGGSIQEALNQLAPDRGLDNALACNAQNDGKVKHG